MNTSEIVSTLISIGPLIIGLAIAVVALQQWQVAHNKLRLDLFDRRYKVFAATRKFLAVIMQDSTFQDSQLFEFYAGTSDAEFFFKAAVVDYLSEIRHRALDMRTHQQIYGRMPVGDERSRDVQAVEAAHNQLLWFNEQITAMTKVFAPYLDFSHIKLSAFPLFRSSR